MKNIRSITIGAIIAIGATMWLVLSCNKDKIELNPSGVPDAEPVQTNTNTAKHSERGVRNDETVTTYTYTAKHTEPGVRNDETVTTYTYTE